MQASKSNWINPQACAFSDSPYCHTLVSHKKAKASVTFMVHFSNQTWGKRCISLWAKRTSVSLLPTEDTPSHRHNNNSYRACVCAGYCIRIFAPGISFFSHHPRGELTWLRWRRDPGGADSKIHVARATPSHWYFICPWMECFSSTWRCAPWECCVLG